MLQDLISDLDSDGATVEEWVDQAPDLLSADIRPLSGRELIAAQAVQSRVATQIVMRFRPRTTARMRVVHRETFYNIVAVIPDPETGRTWMTLQCESGVSEGN